MSAAPCTPAPTCEKKLRRERRLAGGLIIAECGQGRHQRTSIDIQKHRRVQQGMANRGQRALAGILIRGEPAALRFAFQASVRRAERFER